MLNGDGSYGSKTHLSPMRLNPLLHEIPVRNSRRVRMPVGIWRELRLHIMIDQVRDQKRMHRLAIAIHVNLHSEPVYGIERLLFRRILLDRPNDSGPPHAFSCLVIFPPEKLPAIRSTFPFCTPEITALIMPAHIESLLLRPYQLANGCRLDSCRSFRQTHRIRFPSQCDLNDVPDSEDRGRGVGSVRT